jgi:hypothetical protein
MNLVSLSILLTGFEYLSNFDPVLFPNFQALGGANAAVPYNIKPSVPQQNIQQINPGPRPLVSNSIFITGFENLNNFDPVMFPNFQALGGANAAVPYNIKPSVPQQNIQQINPGPRPLVSNSIFVTGFENLSNFDPVLFPNFQALGGANATVPYNIKPSVPIIPKQPFINPGPRPLVSNSIFVTGFEHFSNFDPVMFPKFQALGGANAAVPYNIKPSVPIIPTNEKIPIYTGDQLLTYLSEPSFTNLELQNTITVRSSTLTAKGVKRITSKGLSTIVKL